MTTAVGARVRRSDGEAKVRGSADYAVDVVLPGMVHARLWRSPVPAGRVVSLDSSEAERVPGVLAVVSAGQAPQHPTGAAIWDQPLFAWERIRYVGEPVAAVVAESIAAADEALRKLRVDIHELPAVTDPEAALAPGAPLVHPDMASYRTVSDIDWPRYGNVVCDMTSDPGGIDDIFAAAEHVVEDEYRAERQYQAYLESRGAVAEYQAGRYVIHVSHQFPFSIRDRVAAALGAGGVHRFLEWRCGRGAPRGVGKRSAAWPAASGTGVAQPAAVSQPHLVARWPGLGAAGLHAARTPRDAATEPRHLLGAPHHLPLPHGGDCVEVRSRFQGFKVSRFQS